MHVTPVLLLLAGLNLVTSTPVVPLLNPAIIEPRALSQNNILPAIHNDIQIAQDAYLKTNEALAKLISTSPTEGAETDRAFLRQCEMFNRNLKDLEKASQQAKWGMQGDLADSQVAESDEEVDAITHDVNSIVALTKGIMRMFHELASRPDISRDHDPTPTKAAIITHLKGIFYSLAKFSSRIIDSGMFEEDDESICSLYEAKEIGREYFNSV